MARRGVFRCAAAIALCCAAPALANAASLRAVATAVADAEGDYDAGGQTLTPGPGSLSIAAGAAASIGYDNPSPPPARWELDASATGTGEARYGALGGVAHAEARSVPSNVFFQSTGEIVIQLGYTDEALVSSPTLPPGTTTTLRFATLLGASAIHFVEGPLANPLPTGAAARYEVAIQDLDDLQKPPATGALLVNSRGEATIAGELELVTEVGHTVEIRADLSVAARVAVDFGQTQFAQGSADVATQEASLVYRPVGDVALVATSGHDYSVPEPATGAAGAALATLLALRRRR